MIASAQRIRSHRDGWRFPSLLAATHGTAQPDAQHAARAVAADLCRAFESPLEAARWSIAQGEFRAAETIGELCLEYELVPEEQVTALLAELEREHQNESERFGQRRRGLLLRCDRAGIDYYRELLEPIEVLDIGRAAAEAVLRDVAAMIEAAEDELRAGIRHDLGALAEPLRAEISVQIEDLLTAGEFAVAQRCLADPVPPKGRMIPALGTGSAWRQTSLRLDQILYQLDNSAIRPPDVARFVPGDRDPAGRALVEVLHRVAAELPHVSTRTAQAYVRAVQDLIAVVDLKPTVSVDATGVSYSTLTFPQDTRLPQLALTHSPQPVAIGADAGTAEIRLSFEVHDRGRDVAVIDLAAVLSLLATDDKGDPQDRENRALSLLRTVCRQRDFDRVIRPEALRDGGDHARFRLHLWWLLTLIDAPAGAAELEQLLDLSGGHVRPLWEMLDAELRRCRAEGTALSLDDMVRRTEFDADAARWIAADIDDPAALTVLELVVGGYDSEELLTAFLSNAIVLEHSGAHPNSIADFDKTIDRLTRAGYLLRTDSDRLVSCGCGLVRALRRRDPEGSAGARLAAMIRAHDRDPKRRTADEMLWFYLSLMLHENGRVLLDRHEQRLDIDTNRQVRRSREWLIAQSLDLAQECRNSVKSAHDTYGGDGRTPIVFYSDLRQPIRATALPIALRLILGVLVGNAVRAARSTRPDAAQVAITLRKPPDGGAFIEVTDNGPGVAAEVRRCIVSHEHPDSTWHEGKGDGLVYAWTVAEGEGWTLELLPDPGPLGGATFRIAIPPHRMDL